MNHISPRTSDSESAFLQIFQVTPRHTKIWEVIPWRVRLEGPELFSWVDTKMYIYMWDNFLWGMWETTKNWQNNLFMFGK